ncbi:MAG TPA: hypothetical protein VFX79_02815 [Candidatus Saccharimonadales bacterium]|nr:hypothetical protein [Candidatus Saccharimonadales bacterium]
MKLKYTKSNKTFISYLILAGLTILSLLFINGAFTPSASAKISYNNFLKKVERGADSYCAEVKRLNNQFSGAWYDDCLTTYKNAGAMVYFAPSQGYINRQIQQKCSVPSSPWTSTGKSPCGAYATSATKSKSIIQQSGGAATGGSSQGGGGGSQSGGNSGGSTQRPPPISECNKAENAQKRRECKREYRACNPPPEARSFVPICKTRVINKYKNNSGNNNNNNNNNNSEDPPSLGEAGEFTCGTFEDQERNVKTRFDFGCLGTEFEKNGQGRAGISPILDLTFAFVRFMSIGVGIVLVASIIMSAIQYSMSEGNAEVTQKAKSRIRSASMGFIIYIFAYAILQFVIPGGIFQ